MNATLTLAEDATYRFDEEAADRPCRFIERYCQHFEGTHAGRPFTLHPAQRQIVRDLYGWKHKDSGFRRFTDAWLEGAIGAGKSPLLAGIGLYGLMADGEVGAQVYSLASNYGQARIVFETAKRFVAASDALSRRLDVVDREIRHPGSGSVWRIVSGKGPGAGCKPSLILGDEVHQWAGPGAYQDLRDRMFKRTQPLLVNATNAGESRASFCSQLREKAMAALNGNGEASLYPVIWKADDAARTDDEAAWLAANPLLGVTMSVAKVRAACAEAMKTPEETVQFRRLYMGIWPTAAAGRWLDLAAWDACEARSIGEAAPPAGSEVMFGLDMALSDDLCAAVGVWPGRERYYCAAHFWLPRVTAERYEQQHGVPFSAWAKARHVTLVDEPTIRPETRRRIAEHIIAVGRIYPVKVVAYDRAKVEDTVAILEAAGVTCVAVPQGYSLSPGCEELDRRLKERSMTIAPNGCLRWCAENAEVHTDQRGNIWPVKPSAKGRYAGTRWKKIDGIVAAVNAMVHARKHSFPDANVYRGTVCKL